MARIALLLEALPRPPPHALNQVLLLQCQLDFLVNADLAVIHSDEASLRQFRQRLDELHHLFSQMSLCFSAARATVHGLRDQLDGDLLWQEFVNSRGDAGPLPPAAEGAYVAAGPLPPAAEGAYVAAAYGRSAGHAGGASDEVASNAATAGSVDQLLASSPSNSGISDVSSHPDLWSAPSSSDVQ